MKDELSQFMADNFNEFWMDINVRFELGEPFENGTDERINQVNNRVNSIFESVFSQDEDIYLYIKDANIDVDPMFGNTTPNYIYEILSGFQLDEDRYVELNEDQDEDGNKIILESEYKIVTTRSRVNEIPYSDIFKGITNYEQGKETSISQGIYYVSVNREIVFYMYDDRGCIVYSTSKESLREIYTKYNDWLVDYWREYIDKIFKEA
ncbi:DUF3885 domain-containing protein [Paenibacillus marinisediminis]